MGGSAAQYTFQFGTLSFRNKGRDAKSNIEIFSLALSPELRGDQFEWYSARRPRRGAVAGQLRRLSWRPLA